jgi:signal transduction histidine kinase
LAELEQTIALIERAHHGLQYGDADLALPVSADPQVSAALRELDPHLRRLTAATRDLVARLRRAPAHSAARLEFVAPDVGDILEAEPKFLRGMEEVVGIILREEPVFLRRMESIVSAYEAEALAHIASVKEHELSFLAAMLFVVLFLGCFVLLPAMRQLRRTIELGEMAERVRLNQSVLEASMRERERLGRDLHDGLGQILAGIGMMARALTQWLASLDLPEASAAARIEAFVADAIGYARDLARAVNPIRITDGGLASALRGLSEYARTAFDVRCTVETDERAATTDDDTATHLYRIAQEAVTNSVKHGKARNVAIALYTSGDRLILSVRDDGCGIVADAEERSGLGLGNMRDRARLLGGTLEIFANEGGGTTVTTRVDARVAARLAA